MSTLQLRTGRFWEIKAYLFAGFFSLAVVSWYSAVSLGLEERSAPFPVGIAPFLLDANRDPPSRLGSRKAEQQSFGTGFSRWVFGPSGDTWRVRPGLSGAWITDPQGRTYRLNRSFSETRVFGPHGETWRISPRLGGGAWIYGPNGKTYTYRPSLSGGGWIHGPDGRSWRVTQGLTGSIRVER
jgi:hypothetical protein